MSGDIEIEAWLAAQGFEGERIAEARGVLEEVHLTRPGKTRMSAEKQPRAVTALRERYAIHCQSSACIAFSKSSGRVLVSVANRQLCAHCGGSENARAAKDLEASGIRRLVVVGGSPATREELQRLLGDRIELRLVDGTHHRVAERARADLEWADRVLLWGATELHHKVSKQYADVSATKSKVVHVPRRGIAQLLEGVLESVRRARLIPAHT